MIELEEITEDLDSVVKKLIENADSVEIGTAYFSPGDDILGKLNNVQNLRMLVSDEYPPTDPKKLKSLNKKGTEIREYPGTSGKFHSKIIIFSTSNTEKCIIGSANLTYSGLNNNHEACILLDSKISSDKNVIENIQKYYEELFEEAREIDFDSAIQQFERRESLRRKKTKENSSNFWILKTHSTSEYIDHWKDFLREGVISVGWSVDDIDNNTPIDEILEKIEKEWEKKQGKVGARKKVKKFAKDMDIGDVVLVTKGYKKNQNDVLIYGIAKVEDEFEVDTNTSWWKYKRDAKIQEIEEKVPRDKIVEALGLETSTHTIHDSVSMENYNSLCEVLRDTLGISINIE